MQSISKRVFTHEYRAEAVKLVTEQGMGVKEAAKILAIGQDLFALGTGCACGDADERGRASPAAGDGFTGQDESFEEGAGGCLRGA